MISSGPPMAIFQPNPSTSGGDLGPNDPRFSPELSFRSMVEKLSYSLGNHDPGPLVLRELMRRIGIRSRREPGPKGAWFFSFGNSPVEYRGTTKAADALLPMIEDILMQHAQPDSREQSLQMNGMASNAGDAVESKHQEQLPSGQAVPPPQPALVMPMPMPGNQYQQAPVGPPRQAVDDQRRLYKETTRALLQQDMEELASIQSNIVFVSQKAKRKRDEADAAVKMAEEAELALEVHERKLVTLQRRIQAKQHTLAIEEEDEDAKAAETLVHTFSGNKR